MTPRARHVMPADLAEALRASGTRSDYESRPAYQRNDYVGWITAAKSAQTRSRRIAQMIEDGRHWRFDPGSLSLAFAYTGDFGYGVPAWEQLHSCTDLDAWLAERFGALLHPCEETDFTGAHELRMAISASARRAAAGDVLDPTDVDTINAWAACLPISPHLNGGTRPAGATRPAQALATIARDATTTFAHAPGRIRECAAVDCHLIFLDSSRPQSRRWCSMNRCGGRAKSQSHYARHSKGTP